MGCGAWCRVDGIVSVHEVTWVRRWAKLARKSIPSSGPVRRPPNAAQLLKDLTSKAGQKLRLKNQLDGSGALQIRYLETSIKRNSCLIWSSGWLGRFCLIWISILICCGLECTNQTTATPKAAQGKHKGSLHQPQDKSSSLLAYVTAWLDLAISGL